MLLGPSQPERQQQRSWWPPQVQQHTPLARGGEQQAGQRPTGGRAPPPRLPRICRAELRRLMCDPGHQRAVLGGALPPWALWHFPSWWRRVAGHLGQPLKAVLREGRRLGAGKRPMQPSLLLQPAACVPVGGCSADQTPHRK